MRHQASPFSENFVSLDQIYLKKIFLVQKRKFEHHHGLHKIQRIRISLRTKFHLKQTILIFWTKLLPKNHISGQKQKRWTLQSSTNSRIILVTKFHFDQKIFHFWTKFAQKGYFQFEGENLNTTIKFSIFEFVLATISS